MNTPSMARDLCLPCSKIYEPFVLTPLMCTGGSSRSHNLEVDGAPVTITTRSCRRFVHAKADGKAAHRCKKCEQERSRAFRKLSRETKYELRKHVNRTYRSDVLEMEAVLDQEKKFCSVIDTFSGPTLVKFFVKDSMLRPKSPYRLHVQQVLRRKLTLHRLFGAWRAKVTSNHAHPTHESSRSDFLSHVMPSKKQLK